MKKTKKTDVIDKNIKEDKSELEIKLLQRKMKIK